MSGWQDSNLRPPRPKRGAITGLRYTPIRLSVFYIFLFLNEIMYTQYFICSPGGHAFGVTTSTSQTWRDNHAASVTTLSLCLSTRNRLIPLFVLCSVSRHNQQICDRDRIRTCDRLLRRQMLYPAELRDPVTQFAERQGFEPWQHLRADRLAICSVTTPAPLQYKIQ